MMWFVLCVEIIYKPATLYLLSTVNRLLTFGHETRHNEWERPQRTEKQREVWAVNSIERFWSRGRQPLEENKGCVFINELRVDKNLRNGVYWSVSLVNTGLSGSWRCIVTHTGSLIWSSQAGWEWSRGVAIQVYVCKCVCYYGKTRITATVTQKRAAFLLPPSLPLSLSFSPSLPPFLPRSLLLSLSVPLHN